MPSIALDLAYCAVVGLTLLAYVRDRTPARRDTMALFVPMAVVLALLELNWLWADHPGAEGSLVTVLLLTEPYLALRLVGHVHPMSRPINLGALAAIVICSAAVLVFGIQNLLVVLGGTAYFVGAQSLAAIYFAHEGTRRAGSSRNRLLVAAAATGLFGLVILGAAIGWLAVAVYGDGLPVLDTLVRLSALVSAFGYLGAFAPPGWLRRLGQQATAFEFVRQLALLPRGTRPDEIWQQLLETAARVTNASAVAVADRQPDGAAVLTLRRGELAGAMADRLEPDTVAALLAREPTRPLAVADEGSTHDGAHRGLRFWTAADAGLDSEGPDRALLILAFTDTPLFAEDDLELLAVLGTAAARAVDRERAFARLERNEAMLQEAQRHARLGSWDWDIPADRVTWSDELYRTYGLEPQSIQVDFGEFLGRVHPDDRDRVSATVSKALTERRPFSFEHRIVIDGGTVRTLAANGTVQIGPSGEPVRMVGTGQDITERKTLEEQLTHQAFHDALTGMANRALLVDRVTHALSRRSLAGFAGGAVPRPR